MDATILGSGSNLHKHDQHARHPAWCPLVGLLETLRCKIFFSVCVIECMFVRFKEEWIFIRTLCKHDLTFDRDTHQSITLYLQIIVYFLSFFKEFNQVALPTNS